MLDDIDAQSGDPDSFDEFENSAPVNEDDGYEDDGRALDEFDDETLDIGINEGDDKFEEFESADEAGDGFDGGGYGGGGGSPDFSAETLVNLTDLRSPKVADELCSYINNTSLLAATKRSLCAITRTYISQDTILANIKDVPSALNDLNITLSLSIANATSYDIANPDYLMVKSMLRNTYEIMLTRAFGPKRERIIQDQNRSEVLSGRYTNVRPQRANPEKHRSKFLDIFR